MGESGKNTKYVYTYTKIINFKSVY